MAHLLVHDRTKDPKSCHYQVFYQIAVSKLVPLGYTALLQSMYNHYIIYLFFLRLEQGELQLDETILIILSYIELLSSPD